MQKSLIIFSLIVIISLAFADAKTRLDELKDISSQTPSQIEMKQQMQKSTGAGLQEKKDNTSNQFAYPNSHKRNQTKQNMPQKLNTDFKEKNRQNDFEIYNP